MPPFFLNVNVSVGIPHIPLVILLEEISLTLLNTHHGFAIEIEINFEIQLRKLFLANDSPIDFDVDFLPRIAILGIANRLAKENQIPLDKGERLGFDTNDLLHDFLQKKSICL